MDISDYHIATKKIHELREQLRATEDLCQSLVKRIQEGMHWLPMSDDAVFEDGVRYLIICNGQTTPIVCEFIEHGGYFYAYNVGISTPNITHYARITEPK